MNLFELSNLTFTEELTNILYEQKNIRIERIVSTGQTTDWYNQEESEFVSLLSGTAKIEYEDGLLQDLIAGDTLFIPSNRRHRVSFTSTNPPCVWLCFFWK